MDLAYNPHAERARRKNRSSTNINHLTLAPLTAKLPLDDEALVDSTTVTSVSRSTSYLQGKSAPTTPRLLSRSPGGPRSRSHHRTPSSSGTTAIKGSSSTHIARKPQPGSATPRRRKRDDVLELKDRSDSDWLLRTGAIMSTETREFKGQAWLVSRQSSTSLAAMRGEEEEEDFENELARERELASRRVSRRGSSAMADDDASPYGSRLPSRTVSRSHSVAGLRSNLLTPMEEQDSYFPEEGSFTGPDFVNLDEKLEELERDTMQDDEAAIRRLVRHGQNSKGSWISNTIGWSLFSLEENDEDSEDESLEETTSLSGRSRWSSRHFEGISNVPEERMPPPNKDEGAWKDAAWLLSVATKVMF